MAYGCSRISKSLPTCGRWQQDTGLELLLITKHGLEKQILPALDIIGAYLWYLSKIRLMGLEVGM